jgi:DNA-binding transcriptional regulator YiaG
MIEQEEVIKERRFKCDFENCGRVLFSDKTKPFKCTKCGNGTLFLSPPKNHCCECGQPIYGNVDSDREVVCERCTFPKVKKVEELEQKYKRQIRAKQEKEREEQARKGKKIDKRDEPLGIIQNKSDYKFALALDKEQKKKEEEERKQEEHKKQIENARENISHTDLVEKRKKHGWSQKTLAEYFGCSVSYLAYMEKGRKPLNLKALRFVKRGLQLPRTKKKKKEET